MGVITISSRELNQDAGGAKKAADNGPVIIADRGRPAHVLVSFADHRKLLDRGPSLLDALAMPGGEDIAFEPSHLAGPLAKPADLD
jgi:prevent-host-death family protein